MHDFEQDAQAARVYLGGYLTFDKRGVPRKRYDPEESEASDYCRAALARVLRSDRPLDRQLRDMLADMFEPQEDPYRPFSSRELIAKSRSKHRREDVFANNHITRFMWERCPADFSPEKAVKEAMDNFDISRVYAYRLWARHKKIYEAIWGPLPNK
jgi:hypothetical protein